MAIKHNTVHNPNEIVPSADWNADHIGTTTPIGSIMAWLKSYPNTPALPNEFVECNGQTLSDAESPYDGQVIPNLNGGEFLRGAATSGGTGGAATHSHATPMSDLGDADELVQLSAPAIFGSTAWTGGLVDHNRIDRTRATTSSSFNLGDTSTDDGQPPYYNVVWIMRIK